MTRARIKYFFIWMSVVTGIIFGINSLIKLPDEITGPAFFLGIGMAISSTINYYK